MLFRSVAAMPGVAITESEIAEALDELEGARLIHRYTLEDHAYLLMHDHFDHNPHLVNLICIRPRHPDPTCECRCMMKWHEVRAQTAERKREKPSNGRPADDPLKSFLTPIKRARP